MLEVRGILLKKSLRLNNYNENSIANLITFNENDNIWINKYKFIYLNCIKNLLNLSK